MGNAAVRLSVLALLALLTLGVGVIHTLGHAGAHTTTRVAVTETAVHAHPEPAEADCRGVVPPGASPAVPQRTPDAFATYDPSRITLAASAALLPCRHTGLGQLPVLRI